MNRFLVVFRSHHAEIVDAHFVDTRASSPLQAIAEAKREWPPLHGWVSAHAVKWPRGARNVDQAIELFTKKRAS